jgi:predicted dehydrogenase
MTIAVVGLGSVGRRHARNLLALGQTDLILVRTGEGQAGSLEPPLDSVPVVSTLAGAIDRGARVAVVANPTSLHAETALGAVRAGCHVLVEKPVSHDLDGLDELAREAALRNVTVLVGYQYRFHPTLLRARDWLAEGAIGELVAAHAHWGEYLPA